MIHPLNVAIGDHIENCGNELAFFLTLGTLLRTFFHVIKYLHDVFSLFAIETKFDSLHGNTKVIHPEIFIPFTSAMVPLRES